MTDMEAKARDWVVEAGLEYEFDHPMLLRLIKFGTKAHREGMEEAAKVAGNHACENNQCHCPIWIAAAIREKIKESDDS